MRRLIAGTALAVLAVSAFPMMGSGFAATPQACLSCAAVDRFYRDRRGEPTWTGSGNIARFDALLLAVRGAEAHGLDPADYHIDALEHSDPAIFNKDLDAVATDSYLTLAAHLLAGRLDPVSIEPDWTAARRDLDLVAYLDDALSRSEVGESLEALAPAERGYRALQHALIRYRLLVHKGGWSDIDAGGPMALGDVGPRVAQLRARLEATSDVVALKDGQEAEVLDPALEAAVRRFQRRTSLDVDGVVGSLTLAELNVSAGYRVTQIEANLERWRWLAADLEDRYLLVNIADFSLEAHADGEIERQHNVIVGRTSRPTPVFSGEVMHLIVNPWWETPDSLAVRDELPAFRADPDTVERLGFQVLDRSGAVVDPSTIDWVETPSTNFPYRLRQAPGPMNALGEIKFIFPNRHNVYLHDTPNRSLFQRDRRDFSSGCVRVSDPIDLAEWVLSETREWALGRLQEVVATGSETRVQLSSSIPIHIFYWTAVPDEISGIRFVPDLYERDGGLITALEAAPTPLE